MRLAIAICALVATALIAPTAAPAAKGKKRPKLICMSVPETGSRLVRHNVCMTRKQWQEQKQNARDAIDRAQTKQGGNPAG
jgi:hypothetical protein